jgi:transcriptional regulator with XRE-family HTH domain
MQIEVLMAIATTSPVMQFLSGLQKLGGLKGIDIANFTDVSKATVSRWRNGKKKPHPRTQLILSDLHYVVMRLSDYYTADEIRAWLYARHPQLDGARAIDLILGDRSEEVLSILDRLDADAYI